MNGQSGQALPLAIMALAIGSLVVAPFLGYAGTDLIGSRAYGESMAAQSAGDAGVEHAIWSLVNGDLAGELTEPGDAVTYQLGEAINGLAVDITVTANTTGGGSGGDITIIDTLEFDKSNGNEPCLISVSGDICAVAYRGQGSDGFIKTVHVNAEGEIGDTIIDTLEFDGSDGFEPSIIHAAGDVYVIAYRGTSDDGFLKTVSIAANGDIGNSVIDTLEFDGSDGYEPDIIHVSGTTYAIAYRGQDSDGFIKTVSIAANGDIGNSALDTLEFDTSNGHEPSLDHAAGNIYVIAYRGAGNDGFLKTVSIDAGGNIGDTVIDTLEFDGSSGYEPCIIHTARDVFAVSYRGQGNDGFLKTVSINTGGAISNSAIDTMEFDGGDGYEPRLINVSGDLFGLVYRGPDDDGFLKTIAIATGGDIAADAADTLEFDASSAFAPVIIKISNDIYAIAYRGPGSDGFIKTVGIAGGAAIYEIEATAGGTTIHASVVIENGAAAIISWQIK